jgi:Ca-activated chloride channel family protein
MKKAILWVVGFIILGVIVAIAIPQLLNSKRSCSNIISGGSDSAASYGYGGSPPSSSVQKHGYVNQSAAGGTDLPNEEAYDLTFFESYGVNPFIATEDENFSTFGMDVDTASYTITRRYLSDGNIPDKDSIRTEEFINYFDQNYPYSDEVFTISTEGAKSHFGQPNYHLLKIGIKATEISLDNRKPANMVFVIDISGSMQREDRLGQVKISLRKLAENLKKGDRFGLVVYGSNGRIISQLTSDKEKIFSAIDQLVAAGSTNAEQGLTLGYEVARKGFEREKINMIILCSDGVANVGRTSPDSILKVVKSEADKGITLTTLGFGMGNYNDVLMEQLANDGDGSYYYIDTEREADRIVGDGAVALLQTLAMDSKIQVEFNEETVERYRLLGYENRHLEKEDFEDDTVDAGEVGAGQNVTALYEIRIKDDAINNPSAKIATVRIRYKNVETDQIETDEKNVYARDMNRKFEKASPMFRFTASVAEFAEVLKKSYWAKDSNLAEVNIAAKRAVADMEGGNTDMDDFTEFIELVSKAIKVEDK